MTTTMTPNTPVLYTDSSGREYDIDYNSWQEGKDGSAGRATYASITSRSHHIGLVNVAFWLKRRWYAPAASST